MDQNKNTSSKLDRLFENARAQEPVMNLNEVSDLLKNPMAFQKKKDTNITRWFGIFLLIGLSAFGAIYFYNNNSSKEEKSATDLTASTVTTVTPSNSIAASPKAPATGTQNELSAAVPNKNTIAQPENSSNENEKATTVPATEKPATKESAKPALNEAATELKHAAEPKHEAMNKHFEGNSTISFLSDDNKKVKMTVAPTNEVENLVVNDEVISNDKYAAYKSIIDEGIKLKNNSSKGSSGSAENAASAEKQKIMNAMMKELSAEGLVSSNEPFDFTLTGQDVILNSQKQSQETFEKYKQVYEKVTGEKLPAKYNLHIKR